MYDNINELLQDLGLAEREARYWHENYNALQESIVHCRDCKYWEVSKIKGGEGYHICTKVRLGWGGIIAFPNDFCSRGVLK